MEKIFAAAMHPSEWKIGNVYKLSTNPHGDDYVMFRVTRHDFGNHIDWSAAALQFRNTNGNYAIYGEEIPANVAATMRYNRITREWE